MSEVQEERATDRAERQLIEGIVSGQFPPHTDLPGERTLSKSLDLARPALREAMQRLSRDGWLDIQQGKPTRIRDYLKDGNLNILAGLLKADPDLVPNLVPDLLEMWLLLAPCYTASAARRAPGLIVDLVRGFQSLEDEPRAYATAMWELHHTLIEFCGNLVYGLIFNTFREFYHQLAAYYYAESERRQGARDLWEALIPAVDALETDQAGQLIAEYLSRTADFWKDISLEKYRAEVLEQTVEKKPAKKKTKKDTKSKR